MIKSSSFILLSSVSCFIHRTCPSHLNLSLIIALESGIEPHFSYSLLLEIRPVSRVPRTVGNSSGKHLANIHPLFKAATGTSIRRPMRQQWLWRIFTLTLSKQPCLRAIFDHCHRCSFQYSNLGLQTYLLILPNFFNCEKKHSDPYLFYF